MSEFLAQVNAQEADRECMCFTRDIRILKLRSGVGGLIIRSLEMRAVECNFLLMQEDQSVPVNEQMKTLC